MAGQIFNGNINAQATAWMMINMLAFAVLWETFTGWLEKKTEDNKAHAEMLGKVGRELIILGFIAFAVILLKELSLLHFNYDTLHVFEFCDLLVSISVLIYILNCALSSMTMSITQREWDRMAMTQTSVISEEVSSYLKGLQTSGWARFKHKMPFMAMEWRTDADFKILQLLFETKFHMPLHFDYVVYIKLVLQGIVISMANVSPWHWLIIAAINLVWWVSLQIPALHATPDDHICLFSTDCGGNAVSDRRMLAGAPATDGSSSDGGDISLQDSRMWMLVFTGIGWLIFLLQGLIVQNISSRMRRILSFNCHGDIKDDKVAGVLETLQKQLLDREAGGEVSAEADLERDDTETTTGESKTGEVSKFHQMWSHVVMEGDEDEGAEDQDHIMVFKTPGDELNKNSNDILSTGSFHAILFLSKALQLVLDFYFGFYLVHMSKRISLASDGSAGLQVLFHAGIMVPVLLTLYLLMLTTRKIALLFGVLHLNEDAVSDVLQHMELVKSIRRRIQDTLANTKVVQATPDPAAAHEKLEEALKGEVAILTLLATKQKDSRLDRTDMKKMITDHGLFMTLTAENLEAFLDRAAYRSYLLEDATHQATCQTARTLQYAEDADSGGDSILVREFSSFVMRTVADIVDASLAMSPEPGVVNKFHLAVTNLESVDDAMYNFAQRLTRSKSLFRATDNDKSGDISRSELYTALRRFKVPITKKEFREVFRVIDPDQTGSMNLEEWVDFMTSSDAAIDKKTSGGTKRPPLGSSGAFSGSFMKRSTKVHPDDEKPSPVAEEQPAPEKGDAASEPPAP